MLNQVHHKCILSNFPSFLESPLQSAILAPSNFVSGCPGSHSNKYQLSMSRFVAILLAAAFVQSFAFVAPGAPRHALRSSTRYEQMQQHRQIPEETSSPPFAAVLMASFVGLMLGFTSSPNVARAEEAAAPVVVDKKAKLKAEIEKAQAAIKKNAKSKEERLKEQIAQLKEVEKTAETDFATK